MPTITFDPTDIQIVDLPAAFPNAEQASYAWAQHRGITDSPVLGYVVIETDKFGVDPISVVGVYGVHDYASAVLFVQKMFRMEPTDRYAFRVVNVYDFGGKPTIVL